MGRGTSNIMGIQCHFPPRNTLPETNIAPKMDGWNTTFLLGRPIFRCYVSFREGKALIIRPYQGVALGGSR